MLIKGIILNALNSYMKISQTTFMNNFEAYFGGVIYFRSLK
jgi:hypothetical protein